MVRNNDGTGSLKIVQSLDYEDQLQSNGFRFRIQVNDKVRNENITFDIHVMSTLKQKLYSIGRFILNSKIENKIV